MFIADAHCDTLYEIGIRHTDPQACMVTARRMAAGGFAPFIYFQF